MKKSKIVGWCLTILSVIFCLYVSIEVIVANTNHRPPSVFSFSISYVPTDSMVDEIMPGDYILFNKVNFDEVNVNDIIVYRSIEGETAGKFIVHRVIEDHGDYFITQGDNTVLPDAEHITEDMLLGRYICVVSFLGALSGNGRNVLIIFLLISSVVLIVLQTCSIFIKYHREKMQLQQQEKREKMLKELREEILKEELDKRNKK